MDFFNLYNDDEGEDRKAAGAAGSSDGDDSSDNSSEDSADVRARQAAARLRDFGDDEAGTSSLPSALEAFDEVAKPPSFLDPEATRALASSSYHGRPDDAVASTDGTSTSWHGPKGRIPPGEKFDIARLAPALKGAPRTGQDKRGVPYAAVIEGKAKRAKHDDAEAPGVSAAQIAMLGGQAPERKPTPAMGVTDFLDKGVGGAQLPRQRQERKDKEKVKRAMGQSSIGSWKSEAEMVLRQQYD